MRDEVSALRRDRRFIGAMGEMKYDFMTHAEALVHGDLHSGSVMVRHGATAKAFDSEFAFYGPVGFDLSCLFGNYLFAYLRAAVLGQHDHAEWIRGLPGQTWDAFEGEMRRLWPSRVDRAVFTDDYHALGRPRSEASGRALLRVRDESGPVGEDRGRCRDRGAGPG